MAVVERYVMMSALPEDTEKYCQTIGSRLYDSEKDCLDDYGKIEKGYSIVKITFEQVKFTWSYDKLYRLRVKNVK